MKFAETHSFLSPALRRGLWDTLIRTPNDLKVLDLWVTRHGDTMGDEAAGQALDAVAALPGAWLARIWTTRKMLMENRLDQALAIYKDILDSPVVDGLAVQEMSGHLGAAGHFDEAIDLLLPVYRPRRHGPVAGLNLLHACEDADDREAGLRLVSDMLAAPWPHLRTLLLDFRARFQETGAPQATLNRHLAN